MLARKYDSYAWEFEEKNNAFTNRTQGELLQDKFRQCDAVRLRRRIAIVAGLFLMGYLSLVMLSVVYVNQTDSLVELKQREEKLLGINEELKIEVDYLKSPLRITRLARNQLGMSTARNNIYVQANDKKITYDSYAYAR